jgi:hypothetical protein
LKWFCEKNEYSLKEYRNFLDKDQDYNQVEEEKVKEINFNCPPEAGKLKSYIIAF